MHAGACFTAHENRHHVFRSGSGRAHTRVQASMPQARGTYAMPPLLFVIVIDPLQHILDVATNHGVLHRLNGKGP